MAAELRVGGSVVALPMQIGRRLPVVIATGDDFELPQRALARNSIDETMVAGDASRPPSRKVASQRFRFAKAPERIAPGVFNELIHPCKSVRVVRLPIEIVAPRFGDPQKSHPCGCQRRARARNLPALAFL